MWLDINPGWEREAKKMTVATKKWIKEKLSEGELVGFIVKDGSGKVAGSGCVWLSEEQPRPDNPRQAVPHIISMYTEEEFRRKGVAKMVMKAAIKWCRKNGYKRVVLHASDKGKPLYETFGFKPSREMRLTL
jgi:GNAT superfamily N-acetyltransferase